MRFIQALAAGVALIAVATALMLFEAWTRVPWFGVVSVVLTLPPVVLAVLSPAVIETNQEKTR